MSWQDIAAIISFAGGLTVAVRFLTKHYLAELKPNGGSSMNDRLTRLEERVETIIRLLER